MGIRMYNYKLNIDLEDPNFIWFLGYLWADGHVKASRLEIGFSIKDDENISKIINKLGDFNRRHRLYKDSNSETIGYNINGREFTQFFIDNDYENKSHIQPTKILGLIPDNLKHYFYLGLFDGDGSIYYHSKQKTYGHKISITSTIDYDWSFYFDLLKSIGVETYFYYKKDYKAGKSSDVQICKNEYILKLGNYLYQTYDEDNIGLKRKYDKFMLIKNAVEGKMLKDEQTKIKNNINDELKQKEVTENWNNSINKYLNALEYAVDNKMSLYKTNPKFKTGKIYEFFKNVENKTYCNKPLSDDYCNHFNDLLQKYYELKI